VEPQRAGASPAEQQGEHRQHDDHHGRDQQVAEHGDSGGRHLDARHETPRHPVPRAAAAGTDVRRDV
jgi:hypothetical protein